MQGSRPAPSSNSCYRNQTSATTLEVLPGARSAAWLPCAAIVASALITLGRPSCSPPVNHCIATPRCSGSHHDARKADRILTAPLGLPCEYKLSTDFERGERDDMKARQWDGNDNC